MNGDFISLIFFHISKETLFIYCLCMRKNLLSVANKNYLLACFKGIIVILEESLPVNK